MKYVIIAIFAFFAGAVAQWQIVSAREPQAADLPSTHYGMQAYRDELTGCEYLSLPGQHVLIPRMDADHRQLCIVVLH